MAEGSPGHLDKGDLAFGVAVDPNGGAAWLVEAFPEHAVCAEKPELAGFPASDLGGDFARVDADPASGAQLGGAKACGFVAGAEDQAEGAARLFSS